MGQGELGMLGSSLWTPPTPSPFQEAFLMFAWMHVAQKEGVRKRQLGCLLAGVHPVQGSMLSVLGPASPGAGARM